MPLDIPLGTETEGYTVTIDGYTYRPVRVDAKGRVATDQRQGTIQPYVQLEKTAGQNTPGTWYTLLDTTGEGKLFSVFLRCGGQATSTQLAMRVTVDGSQLFAASTFEDILTYRMSLSLVPNYICPLVVLNNTTSHYYALLYQPPCPIIWAVSLKIEYRQASGTAAALLAAASYSKV